MPHTQAQTLVLSASVAAAAENEKQQTQGIIRKLAKIEK
jgi:hypothetical protein